MKHVKVFGEKEIAALTRKRAGEEKFGQHVLYAKGNVDEDLKNSACRFVLVGIPEDIGVRANLGRAGAATAVKPAFESILNLQHNALLDASIVFVLGEIEVHDLMLKAEDLNPRQSEDLKKLRALSSEIDARVFPVIRQIVELGKIPIIIGGGHNNAYGSIRGTSEALGQKINVMNCDPHLDFRLAEGRHSGNGFSYAFEENYLAKYFVLATHEQYNNQTALMAFQKDAAHLQQISYESIFVREEIDFNTSLARAINFVKDGPCGIEIDLDAITNVPSSAKTSSGISPVQARRYLYEAGKKCVAKYLHIAEGAPVLAHIKADNKTGKLIAYLVCDFMKGVLDAE